MRHPDHPRRLADPRHADLPHSVPPMPWVHEPPQRRAAQGDGLAERPLARSPPISGGTCDAADTTCGSSLNRDRVEFPADSL